MSAQMILCQLCGTQQPNAWDCAVCGHPLHERPPQQVEAATLPDLESTLLGDGGNVALEALPGLELTSQGEVAAPDTPLLELEATAVSRRSEVPVAEELVPDLEPTALDAAAAPTVTAAVTCRYCGTPWQARSGIFCVRCGMRVPAVEALPRAAAEAVQAACSACGTPRQVAGAPCGNCGQRVTAPS